MKRTNSRKILISLMMVIIMLLVLSVKEEASTRMMDELVAIQNNNNTPILRVGGQSGLPLYQMQIMVGVDENRSLSEEIAYSRIYYGKDEIINVSFIFSKAISSKENVTGAQLEFKLGNKNYIIKDYEIEKNKIVFSYPIQETDEGEFSLYSVNGSVSIDGETVDLAIQGNDLIYKQGNKIIAKGKWKDYETVSQPISNPSGYNAKIIFKEAAYSLNATASGSEIKPLSQYHVIYPDRRR